MKVNKLILAISVVTILFGSIAISSALGLWSTKSSKIPVKFSDGEYAGEYNPVDIRGSYSFANISSLFNIPLNDLATAFTVPNDEPKAEFMCKYLEEMYTKAADQGKEVGTNSVRVFVALYKGLPIELDESTYFPETAEQILLDNAQLNDNQKEYLHSHLVEAIQTDTVINTDENTQNQDSEEKTVNGKTTFKEIIAQGVNVEKLEELIKGKILDENQTIRDYCSANELKFSEIKVELEQLLKSK